VAKKPFYRFRESISHSLNGESSLKIIQAAIVNTKFSI